jgi:hypothetical protein
LFVLRPLFLSLDYVRSNAIRNNLNGLIQI